MTQEETLNVVGQFLSVNNIKGREPCFGNQAFVNTSVTWMRVFVLVVRQIGEVCLSLNAVCSSHVLKDLSGTNPIVEKKSNKKCGPVISRKAFIH